MATRELRGVVADPEHVALAWCARCVGQKMSRTVKDADGLSAFQRAVQRAMERKDLVLGSEQEEGSDHRQVLGRCLSWASKKVLRSSWKHLLVVCRIVERRPREDAADPVFFNTIRDCCQMTSRENPENQESNHCDLLYVLCILTFLLQSTRNQPSHVECTSEIQSSWPDMGALVACIGCASSNDPRAFA